MRNKLLFKGIVFSFSSVALYLSFPEFIGVGLSQKCILINFIVIFYSALAVLSLYEFYVGDKFSPGIQMYRIKSLKDDSSKLNIFHRRIGAAVVCILDVLLLWVHLKGYTC
jgi:uncharacterized RDD family membrane protein YckC